MSRITRRMFLKQERKAKRLYEELREEYELEKSNKIEMPGWQLKFFYYFFTSSMGNRDFMVLH